MFRTKVILVALGAIMACAVTAAAASAHGYRVGGKIVEFDIIKTHSLDLSHTAVFKATPFGVSTQIECKHTSDLFLIGTGGITKEHNTWSTCNVVKPAKCNLKETSAAIKGLLLAAGEIEFSAEETSFDTITLEGAECSLKEKPFEVTGSQRCTIPEPESEKAEHSVECTTAGSNLKAGGKVATFEGTVSGIHIINEAGEPTGELWSSF
jgi:hypothetical protein